MSDETVNLLLDAKSTLGEGAIWHGAVHRLYWVDIFHPCPTRYYHSDRYNGINRVT